MFTLRQTINCKKGSAWDTWRKAGVEWRRNTWATTDGAFLVAAVAFAGKTHGGKLERSARKRAFLEGARLEGARLEGARKDLSC